MAAYRGFKPARMAKGSIMAPTRATDGEGHKNREKRNMENPSTHQVTEGVFMIFAMGVMRR